jgi:signal transduction histidine kinase
VILAVIFGLWNSHRLAAPIKSLADTSAQMGEGNLSVRTNLKSGGEIGALADQFNRMADNLQATIQQLESERDALRRFIADVSHELRTPITALKNFNTLLLGPATQDPNVQQEFLTESQAQIERLEWITANLLDLSRMDAGLMDLDLVDSDLRDIIQSAISPFKTLVDEKNILLVTQLPDFPVPLPIDRPRLEMAIGNLLDNAIKFTPNGGEVRVSLMNDPDHITLVVQDTGEGIPTNDLPFIFERFYRGRSHSMEGSGLGLSIVKSVVEAQGGTVDVESIPGGGTTFRLIWDSNDPNPAS